MYELCEVSWVWTLTEEATEEEEKEGVSRESASKNKNPTQRCGEQILSFLISCEGILIGF